MSQQGTKKCHAFLCVESGHFEHSRSVGGSRHKRVSSLFRDRTWGIGYAGLGFRFQGLTGIGAGEGAMGAGMTAVIAGVVFTLSRNRSIGGAGKPPGRVMFFSGSCTCV